MPFIIEGPSAVPQILTDAPDLVPIANLLDDLPPFEQSSIDIQGVVGVVAVELARVESARRQVIQNFFPTTASGLLRFYEQLLGLPIDSPQLTVAQRQQTVQAFMRRLKSGGTGLEWEASITSLVGNTWTYQEHIAPALDNENLVPNPGFETGTGTWAAVNATMAQDATHFQFGTKALKVTPTATGSGAANSGGALIPAGTLTMVSAYVWSQSGDTFELQINNGTLANTSAPVTVLAGWTRISANLTAPAGANSYVVVLNTTTGTANPWWLDGVMATTGTTLTNYFDGSMSGYGWVGTAWASPSYPVGPPAYTILIKLPFSGPAGIPTSVSASLAGAGTGALAANTYYYAVTATTAYGETLIGTPYSIVSSGTRRIDVTWTAGASPTTGYKIYRGLSPSTLGLIGSATTNAFSDDGSASPGTHPPTTDSSSSMQVAQVLKLARSITPAHLDISVGYIAGFLIGISQIGIEPL